MVGKNGAPETVHALQVMKSASKITEEQFLALRVLWPKSKDIPMKMTKKQQ
jgi:hypothetical protein